jgi:uroporphyrinogen-III synthase
MILLNTRPLDYRAQFAADFAGCGLPLIASPVLRFETVAPWPGAAADYDALIFTSPAAAVRRPADEQWSALPVYAVGPATAAAARAAGFRDVRRRGATAADLVAVLDGETFRCALHPGGEDVTIDLSRRFAGRIARAVIYRAAKTDGLSLEAVAALRSPSIVIAPLFSRRSAEAFADLLRSVASRAAPVIALGISATAVDVPGAPWDAVVVPSDPNATAMADAVIQFLATCRQAA